MVPWRLWVQVCLVVGLFAAALGALWWAGASVVDREQRRVAVQVEAQQATEALAEAGVEALTLVPIWPDTLDPETWSNLNAWLAQRAREALADRPHAEGGYYVPAEDLYLGYVPRGDQVGASRDRPGDHDLIDQHVREALDIEAAVAALIDGPGGALAVRAVPVRINGRTVAATWAVVHLDDGPSLEEALGRYRLAAGLAIAGITLALVLAASLGRTVRRQAHERDRLQAELRRSERLAALGKLLAGVAHEVRNPLAAIRSSAQLWQRGVAADADAIQDVIAEVDRLDGLVARLLQFSKTNAADMAPEDLNTVVAEAARLARPIAEAQGVTVEEDLAAGLPRVPMSAPAVLQVLRNLTTNALQAMPEGGTLRLSTRPAPANGHVLASVRDTGPGLTDEARDHLFEPFFSTKREGTGLGLAIAREIALAHHGDLEVRDRPGVGTEFTLSLPGEGRSAAPLKS